MKKILMSFVICVCLLFGMTNVGAITAADMAENIIDFSEILEYSLAKDKHSIKINGFERDDYTAYYQWIDVTSKHVLIKKVEEYNLAVANYKELLKTFESASSEEKEAIDKEVEKARVASLEAQTTYYEQLTNDGMYAEDKFQKTADLDVSNANMKEGHTYLLWVKVVVKVDESVNSVNGQTSRASVTKEYYNHAYVHAIEPSVAKETEEENPDTAMSNPYTYLVPLFLVTGVSALLLKNRYSH